MPAKTASPQLSLFSHDDRTPIRSMSTIVDKPDRIGPASVDYIESRQILTRATGFMDSYDFTLNPYSGCSFGCSYCYAAFFNYDTSKEQTWGQWVTVKENASTLMQKRRKGSLNDKRIYMSSVTDPYQPIESKLNLTRQLLEILAENHLPKLVVQTRSPTVVRDIDLYRHIEDLGGRVQVNMTITTDDEEVRKAFEPSCPSNTLRLEAIKRIHKAGIEACITMTPLLLVRNDEKFIEELIETNVPRFIAQPFHVTKGRFVAGTRGLAFKLLLEMLDCDKSDLLSKYNQKYLQFFDRLKTKLNEEGLPPPGEGKNGFKPPF